MEETLDLSIVICCYNSEKRLPKTLYHLSKQNLNGLTTEVVIVDNNSSDSTSKISLEIWSELSNPFQLRVIYEPNPGISNARKTGINNAFGQIIVFCDDDNWLHEDYLTNSFKIMNFNTEIGVLGGRGIPVFDGDEPDWFNSFQSAYAVGFQSLFSGEITSRGYVWGAGCCLRRSILLQLYSAGFNSLCTGRKDKELISGDDSEICKWHILIGKKLWYDESLVFRHFIENHKLKKDYLEKLYDGFNLSGEILNLYDEVISYEKSRRLKKIIFHIRRLKNLLFDYKKFSLKYHYHSQLKKSLINYFKYLD